jgi:hypothetical protein
MDLFNLNLNNLFIHQFIMFISFYSDSFSIKKIMNLLHGLYLVQNQFKYIIILSNQVIFDIIKITSFYSFSIILIANLL